MKKKINVINFSRIFRRRFPLYGNLNVLRFVLPAGGQGDLYRLRPHSRRPFLDLFCGRSWKYPSPKASQFGQALWSC